MMKGSRATSPASPPTHVHPRFAIPEHAALRALHRALGRGGLPSRDARTPVEQARIAGFRFTSDLLALLEEFQRRVERGEPCRLVEREQVHEPGRLLVEFLIEPPEARP